jgi:flagellar basal-body rod protein FlgB
LDEISAAVLKKALDGLSTRYAFIAQNIANANTPNYRPAQVSFEEALRAAAAQGSQAVAQVQPEVHFNTESAGSPEMRLDLELADASQTAMRYRAMLEILGRQMALHRAVVSEGGR